MFPAEVCARCNERHSKTTSNCQRAPFNHVIGGTVLVNVGTMVTALYTTGNSPKILEAYNIKKAAFHIVYQLNCERCTGTTHLDVDVTCVCRLGAGLDLHLYASAHTHTLYKSTHASQSVGPHTGQSRFGYLQCLQCP
jgi:hypothetical protein